MVPSSAAWCPAMELVANRSRDGKALDELLKVLVTEVIGVAIEFNQLV
jgi:hypothetical protein